MTIIGFNFRKMVAERNAITAPKVDVSSNVAVKKVEEAFIPVGTSKQKALKFSYEYTAQYKPNVGSMTIEGDLLFLTAGDTVDKVIKEWKKKKFVDKEILSPVLNTILTRCSIKGLTMSQDLGLPSPLQLPKVMMK